MGAFDQRLVEARVDVLVYSSQPLENDVEVTGDVSVILYASSSTRDTDFTAKLVDVSSGGEGSESDRWHRTCSFSIYSRKGELDSAWSYL